MSVGQVRIHGRDVCWSGPASRPWCLLVRPGFTASMSVGQVLIHGRDVCWSGPASRPRCLLVRPGFMAPHDKYVGYQISEIYCPTSSENKPVFSPSTRTARASRAQFYLHRVTFWSQGQMTCRLHNGCLILINSARDVLSSSDLLRFAFPVTAGSDPGYCPWMCGLR